VYIGPILDFAGSQPAVPAAPAQKSLKSRSKNYLKSGKLQPLIHFKQSHVSRKIPPEEVAERFDNLCKSSNMDYANKRDSRPTLERDRRGGTNGRIEGFS
jgi:hypothetical protein